MLQTRFTRAAAALAVALASTWASADASPPSIRVALNPNAIAASTMSADALARLRALTGEALTLSAVTRTGALELALPANATRASVDAAVKRLRNDRAVLWAEPIASATLVKAKAASTRTGDKLMLRLAADAPPIESLLPIWSAALGTALTVDRDIAGIIVLRLAHPVTEDALDALALRLQEDPSVRYADAVRRVFAQRVPNNALYDKQWALFDAVGGIDAPAAWDLETGDPNITVAVVDTGILPHPALAGRLLPGYDFVSDPGRANDGDGRDSDPTDPGDYVGDGECGSGSPAENSSWHGTFVAGIIGANADTGVGTVGVDWKAKIVPVRVLGKCGGSFDDIVDGMMWAGGVPVAGVPVNANPARVINMSLGGDGGCPHSIQDAIDTVMAQGAVVVVAAGNSTDDASQFTPAGCSGVITVGATTRDGDRTSYSNYGHRVDISAPGGGGVRTDWILSTSNDGTTTATTPDYLYDLGTSFAAPHVTGTVSLMLARNANLTPSRVTDIITATARPFAPGVACSAGTQCGAGLLDAGLAVRNTLSATASAPAGTIPIVEYYRADRDHYFMTGNAAEIASLDAAHGPFARTGEVFYAWASAAAAPANAVPVCRFYSPDPLIDSHFYTASASECQFVRARYPGTWLLETPAAFYVMPTDGAGDCPAGSLPVYRFFDNRRDANHRHTIDLTVKRAMLNRAWVPKGTGPNAVAFCAPA